MPFSHPGPKASEMVEIYDYMNYAKNAFKLSFELM